MCDICDGKTFEEAFADEAQQIAESGWMLMAVSDGPRDEVDPESWVYTMGLLPNLGHPELIVLRQPIAAAAAVLRELASIVSDGKRLKAGGQIAADPYRLELRTVHRGHFTETDRFARWMAHFAGTKPPKALQISFPPALTNPCFPEPDLSLPPDQPGCGSGRARTRRRGADHPRRPS